MIQWYLFCFLLPSSYSEKLQLSETLSQMQICRSSMQLHIKQLEVENSRLKKELAEAEEARSKSALVCAVLFYSSLEQEVLPFVSFLLSFESVLCILKSVS